MSFIDGVFDLVDKVLEGDIVNFAFYKCSVVLNAVSRASSIHAITIIHILLALLLIGAVAMVYLRPHFKDFILRIVGVFYPVVQTLDALEGDDAGLLKTWFSYWLVFAFVRIAGRVCKVD
jgi:hypothetical protein